MATLRVSDQRRVAPGQAPGNFAAPTSSAGEIAGRQLQQLGQGIQQAGSQAASIYTAELERINETRVNDALNRAQAEAATMRTEYTQLRGEAALRVGENDQPVADVFVPRYEQRLGEIADELRLTDTQRQRYQQQAAPLATRFGTNVQEYQLVQQDAYDEGVYTSGVAGAQSAIMADPLNPESVAEQAERITALTRARGSKQGLPAEAIELAVRDNVGKAFLDSITAMGDEAPREGQDLLDRYRDQMTPAQQAAARNAVAGGLATQDAAAWVDSLVSNPGSPPNPGEPGASFQMPLAGVDLPGPGDRDFGPRTSFRTSNGRRASSDHDGVDFSAPAGSAVRAVAGGRVVRAGVNGGYGNFVEIDHGNGVVIGYAHLQDFEVREGDTVAPGQTFGRVGSTGNSTGPHLHLRARRNGERMDPAELFSEESRTAPGPVAASRPTRAEAERMARERFGTNPVQLNAARAEIARTYGMIDAEEREGYEQAQDEAYRYIETNKRMPPASVMARLRPGQQGSMQNYFESLTAPPTVRSDPALLLAIAANPDLVKEMTPQEIVAQYGRQLSSSDLISLVGTSARAGETARNEARDARVVPSEAFSRAWSSVLDTQGVDRTPTGRTADAERQGQAQLMQGVRGWIIDKQTQLGRQLTEDEIRTEVAGRVAQLSWERPRSVGQGGDRSMLATSYATMAPALRDEMRGYLQNRGVARPTEAQVYQEYINKRILER